MIEAIWPGEFAAVIVDEGIGSQDREDLEKAGITIETAGQLSDSSVAEGSASTMDRDHIHPPTSAADDPDTP
jgi:hypothetical protein